NQHAQSRGLCPVIQDRPQGEAACATTAARMAGLFGQQHRRNELEHGALTYTCHAGLQEIAVPIVLEGEYLGCLLAGGFLVAGDEERALAEVDRRLAPLGLPTTEHQLGRARHPRLTLAEVSYLNELMELCAEEIVAFQSEISQRSRRVDELQRELHT